MNKVYLILLVSFLLASCENDIAEVNKLFSKEETQVEVAKGVELLYSDSARLTMRIECPVLIRHLDKVNPWQEFPEGILVEFFGDAGGKNGSLTADFATREENANKFVVRKNVVWVSQNGEQLETEELIWDEVEKKVFTNKFVVVKRTDEIVYGHGFESNNEFTRWKIRAIEGRVRSDDYTKDFKN